MAKAKRKLTWRDKEYWQKMDWKELFKKTILPPLIASLVGLFLGYRIHSLVSATTNRNTSKISNTVDLPTQVSLLQNTELSVLENTIKILDNTEDETEMNETKESRLNDTLAGLNYNNEIKDFLTTYLSINYKNLGDESFSSISRYLPDEVNNLDDTTSSSTSSSEETTDKNAEKVKNNILKFLNGNSWGKKTESQTSIAGTPIVSTLTGTSYDTRYYLVIVPATNELRDYANLAFVMKMDSSQKILDVAYLGEVGYGITFDGVNKFYDNLATVLDNNGDGTNYDELPEND